MFVVRLDDLMTLPGFKFYQSVEIILLEINETAHMLKFKHLHKHFHQSGHYSAHSYELGVLDISKTKYFLTLTFLLCWRAASLCKNVLMLSNTEC